MDIGLLSILTHAPVTPPAGEQGKEENGVLQGSSFDGVLSSSVGNLDSNTQIALVKAGELIDQAPTFLLYDQADIEALRVNDGGGDGNGIGMLGAVQGILERLYELKVTGVSGEGAVLVDGASALDADRFEVAGIEDLGELALQLEGVISDGSDKAPPLVQAIHQWIESRPDVSLHAGGAHGVMRLLHAKGQVASIPQEGLGAYQGELPVSGVGAVPAIDVPEEQQQVVAASRIAGAEENMKEKANFSVEGKAGSDLAVERALTDRPVAQSQSAARGLFEHAAQIAFDHAAPTQGSVADIDGEILLPVTSASSSSLLADADDHLKVPTFKASQFFTHERVSPSEQVQVTIRQAVKPNMDRVMVELEPAGLGRVEVRMEMMADGRAHVAVTAENRDTLYALQRDAGQLERALQEAGINADSGQMEFNLQRERESEEGEGNDIVWSSYAADAEDEEYVAPVTSHYTVNVTEGVDIKV